MFEIEFFLNVARRAGRARGRTGGAGPKGTPFWSSLPFSDFSCYVNKKLRGIRLPSLTWGPHSSSHEKEACQTPSI